MLLARSRSVQFWLLTSKRSHISTYRFKPIPVAQNCNIDDFRQLFFDTESPAILSNKVFPFKTIPAYTKWFASMRTACSLDLDYFDEYADKTIVPLELTQAQADGTVEKFERLHAPLRLFIDYLRLNMQDFADQMPQRTRLYVAQANISDLPPQLQADLPAPSLVLKAGNGDIYNANIWMGMPPTNTPLHCDSNPNLFVQLAGKKRVRLYTPSDGSLIYHKVKTLLGRPHTSNVIRKEEMMQGKEKEALDSIVWDDNPENTFVDRMDGFEVELGPGDGLFIPKRWWHSIRSTGTSFTASVRDINM